MTRIKIKDLPKDMKIGKDEMKQIFGGLVVSKYIGETEKNLSDSQDFGTLSDLQLLELQQAMQAKSQMLTQISNIMKEYDDTAKALINNIR